MAFAGKTVIAKKFSGLAKQKLCAFAGTPVELSRNWNSHLESSRSLSCSSAKTYCAADWLRSSSPLRTNALRNAGVQYGRFISRTPIRYLAASTGVPTDSETKKLADQILGATQAASAKKPSEVLGVPSPSPEEEEEKRKKDAFARRAMKWSLIAMGCSFAGAAGFAIVEWVPAWKQYCLRSWKELVFYEKMIKEPSREKLLPDPLKEPYHQPPYTLVLEMTGILVHPDWTYATGWRFKKRPGVEYFLEQLAGPYFEIVIYTNEQAFTAYPILLNLDPNGYIMYKLFRDSTRYINGKHIKDLSYMNRDVSKTIVVEWDPNVVPGHTRNTVFLPKWTGNDDDRTLFELAAFLKTLAASEVEDVREVLDNYRDEDDIMVAFRKRQQMLKEEQSKAAAFLTHAQEEKDKRSLLSSFSPSLFGRR